MFKKISIVLGIILAVVVISFISLFLYYFLKTPSLIPEIVKVDFPEKIPLNQEVEGTLEFQDGDDDITQLKFESLDEGGSSVSDSVVDLSHAKFSLHYGGLTFSQYTDGPQFALMRFILVDSAGHKSEPYILKYQAGDPTDLYNHYDNEQATPRPISQHKKVHFFILSGTGTELETDSRFASDNDITADVSPAVAKIFEKTVIPHINGLWDQCGIAFDPGMIKVVRAEKVKLNSGRLLSHLYGNYNKEPAVVADAEGLAWLDDALLALKVPKGDIGIFIFGYPLWDLELNINPAGLTGYHGILISWPYIHFLNKDTGEIILPKRILALFAHELGHALGLEHPDEETTISQNKFSKFNLMNKKGLYNELIPEQCAIVHQHS